jgi:hypothetical protein
MKTFSHFSILAGVSCALALSACDSIKDVPNEDAADLPAPTAVLSGQIYGLSSLRAITLQNNDDTINTRSFINAAPTVPNEGIRPVPFSFGTLAVGSPYNITVKDQPEFKNCVVTNGQGVITEGVRPDVVVTCTPTGTRYDLTVNLPSNPAFFKGLEGAKVRVTTEEEIREFAIPANYALNTVFFDDVLLTAPGSLNPATYTVTASTFEENRLNKCVVTNPSRSNPTGPISDAVVGAVTAPSLNATAPACAFTVGGKVGYSLPPGQNTVPSIVGLKLQLRTTQQEALQDLDVACGAPNASTTTTNSTTTLAVAVPVVSPNPATPPSNAVDCQYRFTTPVRSSSTSGLYEVAVAQHPVGQFCIVVNGGSVSVFTQGLVSPVNVDNANVYCRATPVGNKQLRGVFRLQSTTFVPAPGAEPRVSAWAPFDLTKQNTASSNMMSFFDNGTYLYGTHANGVQVEHGFYDYDHVAKTLRFTNIVDTNTATAFPANFSPLLSVATTSTASTNITHTLTTTAGISALPNPIRRNGTAAPASNVTGFANLHAAMTGVTFGTVQRELDVGVTATVRTISGTFGADAAGIATYQAPAVACSTASPCWNTNTNAATVTTGTSVTGACSTATPCLNASTGASITTGYCGISPNPTCARPDLAYRVSWILEEPPQVDGEMTGAWTTQDSRRLWVWDYRTYYGLGVGMMGGSPSMNDACFTMDDLHASSGIYTRRGSGTGCYPFARPGNDPVSGLPGVSVFGSITPRNGLYPAYAPGTAEAADMTIAPFTLSTVIPQLPGYTGRHPGGEPAPSTSSPSPIYFHIAPAASFATSANATYFPSPDTSWCTTEILGARSTANGFPINFPFYFCRTTAVLPN